MLYKLKSVVESKTLLRIYFSLIHSHLNYAILIWGDAPLTHLNQHLKLQKKAIRIILHKSPLTSCRPLFKELSILTVTSIYILEASCYAKKLLLRHNQHTSHQSLQTTSEMHQHCTRQQNNIYIPNNRKLDIKSKCSIIYNKLPAHLKTIPTIHKFRLSTKNTSSKTHYIALKNLKTKYIFLLSPPFFSNSMLNSDIHLIPNTHYFIIYTVTFINFQVIKYSRSINLFRIISLVYEYPYSFYT